MPDTPTTERLMQRLEEVETGYAGLLDAVKLLVDHLRSRGLLTSEEQQALCRRVTDNLAPNKQAGEKAEDASEALRGAVFRAFTGYP